MNESFFAYLSRMRYIGRWSLMRNALPENIQEHSHMVAVLAREWRPPAESLLGKGCLVRPGAPANPRRRGRVKPGMSGGTAACRR